MVRSIKLTPKWIKHHEYRRRDARVEDSNLSCLRWQVDGVATSGNGCGGSVRPPRINGDSRWKHKHRAAPNLTSSIAGMLLRYSAYWWPNWMVWGRGSGEFGLLFYAMVWLWFCVVPCQKYWRVDAPVNCLEIKFEEAIMKRLIIL